MTPVKEKQGTTVFGYAVFIMTMIALSYFIIKGIDTEMARTTFSSINDLFVP